MPARIRLLAIAVAASVLAAGLSGCGTINEKVSAGMGDYIPQWAGGLPGDAPPRPGTAQYDAWMKERERQRLMPAADRSKEGQAQPPASSSADAIR
ncbi:hypothetical protein C2U70_19705 [Bradyrhizobium guangdongense]|uniref:hypothetical protein n=1 Tax=Bradyrhizobium guangdongense TaxID=1325090 RepID=UPI0011261966|nr:hypothetical protein [Bradyrhizobium guangdongense]TPQ33258.1 hypothetical protein C2U70_19705 [Bradyrhizobium guangdongense]